MSGWVLVTGAAKRIGREIALDLARGGSDIIVHYHTSPREARRTAEDIRALGRKSCLAELDLGNTRLVNKLIPALTAEIGPLAALVNNASLFLPDRLDPENFQEKINADAPRILSEGFYRCARQGVIVNLLDADPSAPGFSRYNKSKKTLADLTVKQALHFAPFVRVNGVAPGPVLPSPRQSPEHFRKLMKQTPRGKSIAPEDVAGAVRFLIGNASMTGAIIPIDGGLHLKRRAPI